MTLMMTTDDTYYLSHRIHTRFLLSLCSRARGDDSFHLLAVINVIAFVIKAWTFQLMRERLVDNRMFRELFSVYA